MRALGRSYTEDFPIRGVEQVMFFGVLADVGREERADRNDTKTALALLDEINLSDADKDKIFYSNARRILGLRDPKKASAEAAAAFLVRTVRQFPHEVTVYAAGPMTDLALAIGLDPQFPELTKELVVMGGSIRPITDDPQFGPSARREFNFWMDPEATRMVLHARWPRVTLTTVDISVKTRMDTRLIGELARASTPG